MRLCTRIITLALLAAVGASTAWSQTTVYGLSGGATFRSDTWDYVDDFTILGPTGFGVKAIDFDASATTLYGVYFYGGWAVGAGVIDLANGSFTDYGAGFGLSMDDITGLASAPDGTYWYLMQYTVGALGLAEGSYLGISSWAGGISFGGGGWICGGRIEAISVDAHGDLYGFNNTDLLLYSIDTSTVAGTPIGPSGLDTTGINGMDFDWSTNTLYATFNMTGGGSVFAVIDPATGLATVLEDTSSIGAREFCCRTDGSPTDPGLAYCFCDAGNPSGNVPPCSNWNDGTAPLGGCKHDDSDAGARLEDSGVARLTADTLVLVGSRGPVSNTSMFFQANNDKDGSGSILGDGLRCAGGGLVRLKVKTTSASGDVDSTPMVISTRSASFGHAIAPGETLYYQWWFRDSGGSPCGTESNTSNGYAITWLP